MLHRLCSELWADFGARGRVEHLRRLLGALFGARCGVDLHSVGVDDLERWRTDAEALQASRFGLMFTDFGPVSAPFCWIPAVFSMFFVCLLVDVLRILFVV